MSLHCVEWYEMTETLKAPSAHLSLLRVAVGITADATRKGPKILENAKKARTRSDKME